MKRTVLVMVLAVILGTQLTGCGPKTCKAEGCSETDLYEDGYCRLHYYENVGTNVLQDIFN